MLDTDIPKDIVEVRIAANLYGCLSRIYFAHGAIAIDVLANREMAAVLFSACYVKTSIV